MTARILTSDTTPTNSSHPPKLRIIIAILICALFCFLGLLVLVCRCSCFRRGSSSSANKGLNKKVLKSLQKFTYNESDKHAENLSDCAICVMEFVNGDEIRLLPECGHGFHVGCIDAWLESHSSCPSCRKILVETSEVNVNVTSTPHAFRWSTTNQIFARFTKEYFGCFWLSSNEWHLLLGILAILSKFNSKLNLLALLTLLPSISVAEAGECLLCPLTPLPLPDIELESISFLLEPVAMLHTGKPKKDMGWTEWKAATFSIAARRAPLLPKLRGHFAEFLRHGYYI